MSQTLVGSRGVTTSRAGASPIIKDTCRECQRTVLLVDVGGERVACDPEHIAVAVRRDKSKGGPARATAHRVHAELCQRYKHDAELAARKARWTPPPRPIDQYRTIDNTKAARASAKRGARTRGM